MKECPIQEQFVKEITALIRKKAYLYVMEDGMPGPLSSMLGWRDSAKSMHMLADDIEEKYLLKD